MDTENLQKIKGQMHSFAMGEAMAQAARDYQKELLASQAGASGSQREAVDLDTLLEEDPELERLHAARLEDMRREARARAAQQERPTYGSVSEIGEAEFLPTTTETRLVVCHFFHANFQRCKIMDRALVQIAPRYPHTRFVRLSATDAPFFTDKLKIRTLPCVILFREGAAVDRIVGFEGVEKRGSRGEDISPALLEQRLRLSGVVEGKPAGAESEDDGRRAQRSVRHGIHSLRRSVEDEDSDME